MAVNVLLLYLCFSLLTHLCVVCRYFCCPVSLFQGHVSCGIHFSISDRQVNNTPVLIKPEVSTA